MEGRAEGEEKEEQRVQEVQGKGQFFDGSGFTDREGPKSENKLSTPDLFVPVRINSIDVSDPTAIGPFGPYGPRLQVRNRNISGSSARALLER